MSGWLFLAAAVVANVVSNLLFKQGMTSAAARLAAAPDPDLRAAVFSHALEPRLWLGALCAGALLGCYLMALTRLPVSVAYVTVTVSAMGLLALGAHLLLGEGLSALKLTGLALAMTGVACMLIDAARA